MSWDTVVDKLAKGGPPLALLVLSLVVGWAYFSDTTDRWTGSQQQRYMEKTDERWDSHSALQAARDLAVDRELSLLRERLNKLEAIAADNKATNGQMLIRMERIDTTLRQMTATLTAMQRMVEKFGERLVKVESWKNGPSGGGR